MRYLTWVKTLRPEPAAAALLDYIAEVDHALERIELLEFCPDGAGNAQCFHRRDEEDDDPRAVDWDHETWEISDETWFADFADRRLGECVADEE